MWDSRLKNALTEMCGKDVAVMLEDISEIPEEIASTSAEARKETTNVAKQYYEEEHIEEI